LADAMRRLAESPDLRRSLGQEALQTARARYIWSTERFAREHVCSAGRLPAGLRSESPAIRGS